jgi:NitT/TauT family transport system substrate-binding protein
MVRKTRMRAFAATAMVLPVVLLSACGTSEKDEPSGAGDSSKMTDITVAVSTTVGSLQADIAAEKGFFTKHGLNAKLTPLTNNTNLPTALGHQFDFGATYQPVVIQAVTGGIDIKAVAGGEIDTTAVPLIDVIVSPKSDIKSPADLEGKRIGSPAVNGIIHLLTLAWIKDQGGDPNKVTAVQVPFASMADQLDQGKVDAVETAAPVQQKLVASGFKSLGDPAQALGNPVNTMQTVWASSAKWADSNKATVEKFVAALTEADAYIAAHKDEAITALSKASGITLDQAKVIPIPEYRAAIEVADMATYATLMKSLGRLKDDSNPEKYIFDPS